MNIRSESASPVPNTTCVRSSASGNLESLIFAETDQLLAAGSASTVAMALMLGSRTRSKAEVTEAAPAADVIGTLGIVGFVSVPFFFLAGLLRTRLGPHRSGPALLQECAGGSVARGRAGLTAAGAGTTLGSCDSSRPRRRTGRVRGHLADVLRGPAWTTPRTPWSPVSIYEGGCARCRRPRPGPLRPSLNCSTTSSLAARLCARVETVASRALARERAPQPRRFSTRPGTTCSGPRSTAPDVDFHRTGRRRSRCRPDRYHRLDDQRAHGRRPGGRAHGRNPPASSATGQPEAFEICKTVERDWTREATGKYGW